MNKAATFSSIFLLVAALQLNVSKAENFYVSGFVGLSDLPVEYFETTPNFGATYGIDFASGYNIGGAVGLRLNDNFRTEIEISTFKANADKFIQFGTTSTLNGDISGIVGLANLWFDLPNESDLIPYAGGGIGFAKSNMNTFFSSPAESSVVGTDLNFAIQLGAGLRMDMTEHVSLDVGYRFKSIRNLILDVPDLGRKTANLDLNMHVIEVGMTYAF